MCFNSLQTGKSFRTICLMLCLFPRVRLVSIPFKRESPFGPRNSKISGYRMVSTFQFPSNGKVLSDPSCRPHLQAPVHCFNSLQTGKSFRTLRRKARSKLGMSAQVSIPFKRESPFGPFVHLVRHVRVKTLQWVSIPFKRESPFGPEMACATRKGVHGFNSLQTGKSFRTFHKDFLLITHFFMFQFPSNGKVLSDIQLRNLLKGEDKCVSIPFKRESPFGPGHQSWG